MFELSYCSSLLRVLIRPCSTPHLRCYQLGILETQNVYVQSAENRGHQSSARNDGQEIRTSAAAYDPLFNVSA